MSGDISFQCSLVHKLIYEGVGLGVSEPMFTRLMSARTCKHVQSISTHTAYIVCAYVYVVLKKKSTKKKKYVLFLKKKVHTFFLYFFFLRKKKYACNSLHTQIFNQLKLYMYSSSVLDLLQITLPVTCLCTYYLLLYLFVYMDF